MNVAETLASLLDVGVGVEEEEEEVMDEEVEEEEEEVMVVVEEGVMGRQIIEVGDIGLVEEVVGIAIIIGTMEVMEDPEGVVVVATAIITTAVMVEDVIVVATAMHKEEIVATTNGKHPEG